MRSQVNGIVATGCFGLLTLLVPPLPFAGATVSLWVMRKGLAQGLTVLFGGAILAALLAVGMTHLQLGHALLFFVLPWLFAAAGAWVLRRSESQGAMLAALALCAVAYLVYVRLVFGDMAAQWEAVLRALHESAPQLASDPERLKPLVAHMTAMLVGLSVLGIAASVLVGRWWQASLFNPGGFGPEFRALRLPRPLVHLGGLSVLIALVSRVADRPAGLAIDVLILLMFVFMVQGLAVVHHLAQVWQWPARAVAVVYIVSLMLLGFAIPVFAVLGMLDGVHDLRRLQARSGNR